MIKKFFKRNSFIFSIITNLLYIYLRIVYFTSYWQFIFPNNYSRENFLTEKGVIFAFWHNRLAFGPGIFAGHRGCYAIISPHSDGRIISSIVSKFGFGVINGSTNSKAVAALKGVIKKLSDRNNIVIAPDGPRGPIYKVNSNINKVAYKYNIKLIPLSCSASRCFLLNSWDKLIIPLPFGKIRVKIGAPLELVRDENQNNINLRQVLMDLM